MNINNIDKLYKSLIAFLLSITLIFCLPFDFSIIANAETIKEPEVASLSAVLMDASTGQVLYSKNPDEMRYPASITKIITILLALENSKPSDNVVISHEAVFSIPSGTSHIALTTDEEVTMEQLVYAAALQSANDACNGIAEHVGGTIQNFVDMMNAKAKQLGTVNTHFANAHGLSDDNHYTTAYDMALITRYALRVEGFIKFFSNATFEMPPNNKQQEIRRFAQQHEMLKPGKYQYDGAICGKVGWTTKSGHTLVTVAERNGRRLICVVMKSETKDQRYNDTKLLFDYGFNEFTDAVLSKSRIENYSLPVSKDNVDLGVISYTIEKDTHYLIRRDLINSDLIFEKNLPEKCTDYKVLPPATVDVLVNNVTGYLPSKILTLNYLAEFIPSESKDNPNNLESVAASATDSIPTAVVRTFWTFVKIIGVIAIILIILFILLFIILLIRKKIVLAARRRRKREKLLNKKS